MEFAGTATSAEIGTRSDRRHSVKRKLQAPPIQDPRRASPKKKRVTRMQNDRGTESQNPDDDVSGFRADVAVPKNPTRPKLKDKFPVATLSGKDGGGQSTQQPHRV